MRAAMLEVINSDDVRTARAKGLTKSRVTMKHALRNALIPLVTLVALDFGTILGGAVVTETVFSLDGMGLYFINALFANDPYPVMAWLMVTAVMIIIFNLIADIAYGLLDPRVRYDSAGFRETTRAPRTGRTSRSTASPPAGRRPRTAIPGLFALPEESPGPLEPALAVSPTGTAIELPAADLLAQQRAPSRRHAASGPMRASGSSGTGSRSSACSC